MTYSFSLFQKKNKKRKKKKFKTNKKPDKKWQSKSPHICTRVHIYKPCGVHSVLANSLWARGLPQRIVYTMLTHSTGEKLFSLYQQVWIADSVVDMDGTFCLLPLLRPCLSGTCACLCMLPPSLWTWISPVVYGRRCVLSWSPSLPLPLPPSCPLFHIDP